MVTTQIHYSNFCARNQSPASPDDGCATQPGCGVATRVGVCACPLRCPHPTSPTTRFSEHMAVVKRHERVHPGLFHSPPACCTSVFSTLHSPSMAFSEAQPLTDLGDEMPTR